MNREEAIRILKCDGFTSNPIEIDEALKIAIQALEESERPHGKWVVHDRPSLQYGCNICGNLTNINSNFCPNCGARMKEGDN